MKRRRKRREGWSVAIAAEGRRRWSERTVVIWSERTVVTVRLGFGDSKECEGWPEVEASPEAFGSWIVAIASEGRRRRRFICNCCELKLGFGNGEANKLSRSEASEPLRRWGWVLATVRNAKGHRKSNRRWIEGMRRVAIWSGYRRFGVGIGVYLTATVYLQPLRAEASPLSLIGDGWAQRRRWLGSSSPKGAEFFLFLTEKVTVCFVALSFFWEGWLLKLGVFSDEFQFRH